MMSSVGDEIAPVLLILHTRDSIINHSKHGIMTVFIYKID